MEPVALTFFLYRVVDADNGVAADIEVRQPARTGPGGIWAVAGARSLPTEPSATPV